MTTPASAEQIAREAAEALVPPKPSTLHETYGGWRLAGWAVPSSDRASAERAIVKAREDLAAAFLAALRRWSSAACVGGGLSEGRLGEIRDAAESYRDWCAGRPEFAASQGDDECSAALCDAVAELDRVNALMRLFERGEERECYAAGYDAGRRAGAREQREADVEAVRRELIGWDDDCGDAVTGVSAALQAVQGAPLVTQGEGDG